MNNVYIRSQDREKLYCFGLSLNCLQYEEAHNFATGKKNPTARHTICISDGCMEEIAEYESRERCMEVLDEIQEACSASPVPQVYEMPKNEGKGDRAS